jgi:hypothetical protein
MKSGMQTYYFLASYVFKSKVLAFVIVKKIRDTDPGSGNNSSRIRIQGVKNRNQDPGFGSATLRDSNGKENVCFFFIVALLRIGIRLTQHFISK